MMPLGMEALLTETFSNLGLQPSQLVDFFPGPAFLAWVSASQHSKLCDSRLVICELGTVLRATVVCEVTDRALLHVP